MDLGQVLEASNGAEGLALASENTFDLILSDINMPVMDGLEFVRRLKEMDNTKNVPIIMITTEGGEKSVLEALSLGAKGYIRKPFTPDQVKEHVIPVLRSQP
jgi:two-component system chemotaxis response regulator CheY